MTGFKPTAIVAALIVGIYFGMQLLNSVIPVSAAGPGSGVGPGGSPVPGPGATALPVDPTPAVPSQPTPDPNQPGGRTVEIGPLRITLPAGWQAGQTQDGGFQMNKGAVFIDVQTLTLQQPADATALCAAFLQQVLAPNATGFAASQPTPVPINNATAARANYTGAWANLGEVEGQVTTIVVGQQAFFFDAWGQAGQLRTLLPEVELMFQTMQVVQ